MTTYTHDTVPTEFVEASGVRFAYRRFGSTDGVRWSSFSTSWAASTTTTRH
jgi:hypothetical protein